MSQNKIIETIKNKHSDPDKLRLALFLVRIRIDYCLEHNIDMIKDPLLSKILLFR